MRSTKTRPAGRARRLAAAASAVLLASSATTFATPAHARPITLPPVPSLAEQYWFGNLRIGEVWQLGATGQGITVAVLDSGVDAASSELRGAKVVAGTDFAGGNGQTDTDDIGHGTAMATLIAGQGGGSQDLTGIAPNATILPVTTVLPNKAAGSQRQDQAIRYAVSRGAKVISMSLGQIVAENGCPDEVAAAVRFAIEKGSVVVAAAGNEGASGNPYNSPALCPGVVAVGAVDGSKRPWSGTENHSYVDLAAPGVQFPAHTPSGVIGESDGTSNATALVSGELALVWSKFPTLTNRQVVARLLATVTDDAQTPGRDGRVGYGISRPYFAIKNTVPANAPNPIFDEVSASPSGSSSAPSSGASAGTSATSNGSSNGSSAPAGPVAADRDSGISGGIVALIVVLVIIAVAIGVALIVRGRRKVSTGPAGPVEPGYPQGPWQNPPPGPQ